MDRSNSLLTFYVVWNGLPLTVYFDGKACEPKISKIQITSIVGHNGALNPPQVLKPRLLSYLSGKLSRQDIYNYLDFSKLSTFQRKIYNSMKKLHQPITYSELAKINGTHARAIARAMAVNPFPIVIPCHLVVAKHGLGGFSAPHGVATKKKLLALEAYLKI